MEALPGKGFEPLQACAHSPLKAACLPIPPPGRGEGDSTASIPPPPGAIFFPSPSGGGSGWGLAVQPASIGPCDQFTRSAPVLGLLQRGARGTARASFLLCGTTASRRP